MCLDSVVYLDSIQFTLFFRFYVSLPIKTVFTGYKTFHFMNLHANEYEGSRIVKLQ